ncbi:matrixin [Microvirga sp. KLBC 81]|uniref:M10 family metallopeptidase n=1 Tax=Microvirga sp. KLBC 81 TaxID=1862707 RepID=UPI000D50837E|nr:M10 family metallopeptidase [Microvirga sp. KLBC 81]PVE24872.1 matrixin [Microvirga sp. KLBC 81]
MPSTSSVATTSSTYINALLGDRKWATNSLTYSFPTSSVHYSDPYGSNEPLTNFGVFLSAQQAAARAALKLYSSVANLTFTAITETRTQHADIRFARSDKPSTAWAYFPSAQEAGGDVWINNSSRIYDAPRKGNYAYLTIIHEIGHALGLEHPHEGSTIMPLSRDSMEYTVMSYRSHVNASLSSGYVNETWGYAQSLMMYDIAAIQHLYGANYTTNSGNTKYTWTPSGQSYIDGVLQSAPGNNRIFQTVWDGGGNDTYNFSQYTTGLTVDLAPGAWTITSQAQRAKLSWGGSKLAAGNIANALLYNDDPRSLIENVLGGSASDVLKGNDGTNNLQGRSGNDLLYGRGGNDILKGGTGNDRIIGQSGKDSMYGSTGADTFIFRTPSDSPALTRDTIHDFKRGEDHIDLRSIDANTLITGNQAFAFIGQTAFTKAGQLRFSGGVLSADVNGDKSADFAVSMAGLTSMASSDFYL